MAGIAATASIAKSAANNINFFNIFYLLFRFTLQSLTRWAHAAPPLDRYI
jgi:hypothetical protein